MQEFNQSIKTTSQRRRIPDLQDFNQMTKTCRSSAEVRRSQPRRPPKSRWDSRRNSCRIPPNSSRILPEFERDSSRTFPGFRSRRRILPRFRSRSPSNPWNLPRPRPRVAFPLASASAPFLLGSSRAVVQNLTLIRVVSKECLYN